MLLANQWVQWQSLFLWTLLFFFFLSGASPPSSTTKTTVHHFKVKSWKCFAQRTRSLKDPPRTWWTFIYFLLSKYSVLKGSRSQNLMNIYFLLDRLASVAKCETEGIFWCNSVVNHTCRCFQKKTEDIVEIVIVVIIIKVWHNAMVVKNSFPQKKTRTNNKLFYVNVFVNETIFLKF